MSIHTIMNHDIMIDHDIIMIHHDVMIDHDISEYGIDQIECEIGNTITNFSFKFTDVLICI